MTESWELERYVNDHPEDYPQRWRLAKKLYMESEYRIALEHLLILRKQWIKKLNVMRYLAATYYRMGRYEDACEVLEEAIDTWPDEVALREQYARVLEAAGQKEKAQEAWQSVLQLNPAHVLAGGAVRRLGSAGGLTPSPGAAAGSSSHDSDPFTESNGGIDLGPKVVCTHCGAMNNAEFDRCWQCHAPLQKTVTPLPSVSAFANRPGDVHAFTGVDWREQITHAIVVAGLLVVVVLVSLYQLSRAGEPPSMFFQRGPTVQGMLMHKLVSTYVLCGAVLVLAWPVALALSLLPFGAVRGAWSQILLVGLFLGAVGQLIIWIPRWGFLLSPILVGILALVVVYRSFRVTVGQTILAWLMQVILVTLSFVAVFVAQHGLAPIQEAGAIAGYTFGHDIRARGTAGVYPIIRLPTPLNNMGIRWQSTNSAWLDENLSEVVFEVKTDGSGEVLFAEIADISGEALHREEWSGDLHRFAFNVQPGPRYNLTVAGAPNVPIEITIFSALRAQYPLD